MQNGAKPKLKNNFGEKAQDCLGPNVKSSDGKAIIKLLRRD
jgi:hypothetical protein